MSKKRKIVVSDLHIGKGKVVDGQINYREDFVYDEDFSDFLKWIVRDSQNMGAEFELILNGDILDVIKSTHRDGKVYKKDVFDFLNYCTENHRVFFEALRDFIYEGGKVIYTIGNHDHPVASPDIQSYLLEKTQINFRFIKKEYFESGVWIEHGNRYEAVNRTDLVNIWFRDEKGEEYLNMPWGTKFVVEVIDSFSFTKPYLDRWRPLGKAIRWGLIFDTRISLLALFRTIKFVLKNRKFYDPIRRRSFYVPLNLVMNAMGHKIVDRSAKILLRRQDIKVAVMGHTHRALLWKYRDKIYANSGTWVPFVSFDTPQIGLIEKRNFVVIDIQGNLPLVGVFSWHGRSRIFEEIKQIDISE
jgi:UDP-2,3-diacylglucosamine pyrophosphatase LpxH